MSFVTISIKDCTNYPGSKLTKAISYYVGVNIENLKGSELKCEKLLQLY
jgi:hypothetical protein